TSREKPSELVPLEGGRTPVRALRLEGLDTVASEQLLEERELVGSRPEREQLIERYGGNPLALKIVAETIVELFGSEIAEFLAGGELIFGSVRELLGEQFDRLSAVEQTLLLWLAILREPVTIEEVLSVLGAPLPRVQVLEAVEALRRRPLIELGQLRGASRCNRWCARKGRSCSTCLPLAAPQNTGAKCIASCCVDHSLAVAS